MVTPFKALEKCHQFASAVIMFGAMLRQSQFMKEVTWNQVLQLATAAADVNNFSEKEFLTIVQEAKNIYSKKRRKDREE
jgi:Ca-activated chloride channel family protein